MKIGIIMPTMGRPENAMEAFFSIRDTKSDENEVEVIFALDHSDPHVEGYFDRIATTFIRPRYYITSGSMVEATNKVIQVAGYNAYDVLGWAADDTRYRTPNWDQIVAHDISAGYGFIQANDLFQEDRKATAFFVRSDIVEALGYLLLPSQRHLYVDDAVVSLGTRSESLIYEPGLIIEHLHPYAGKAEWDATYLNVNNPTVDATDGASYFHWRDNGGLDADVEIVKQCISAP